MARALHKSIVMKTTAILTFTVFALVGCAQRNMDTSSPGAAEEPYESGVSQWSSDDDQRGGNDLDAAHEDPNSENSPVDATEPSAVTNEQEYDFGRSSMEYDRNAPGKPSLRPNAPSPVPQTPTPQDADLPMHEHDAEHPRGYSSEGRNYVD